MLALQGRTVVIAWRVNQEVTRSLWEILHAAHALQTLAQRRAVTLWPIVLAFVGLQDQMVLAACRVHQAAIKM